MKTINSNLALGLITVLISVNGFASMSVETLDNVRSMIHIDKMTTLKSCNLEMVVQKDNLSEELRNYLGEDKVSAKIQATCYSEMKAYLKNYCSSKTALFSDIENLMSKDKVLAIRNNLGFGADDRTVGEVVNFKVQRSLDLSKKRWSSYVSRFATIAKCPIVKKDQKDFENELHTLTDFVKQRFQDMVITAGSWVDGYKGIEKGTPFVSDSAQ